MKHYILDAEHCVIEADLLTWGRWFEVVENRYLARTKVRHLLVLTTFSPAPGFAETPQTA